MVDQTVIEKWWAQLGMAERTGTLYYSGDPVLYCVAGTVAQASYSTLRKEIQEIIETAFLQGREADRFWFGISWIFACPLCNQESSERGMIRFQSEDPQELGAFLAQQGGNCMKCHRTPPERTNVQIQLLKAPVAVLRELDFVAPDDNYPATGTYFTDAWLKAKAESPGVGAEHGKTAATREKKPKAKRGGFEMEADMNKDEDAADRYDRLEMEGAMLPEREIDFEAINEHSPGFTTELIRNAKDKEWAVKMADGMGLKYDPAVLKESKPRAKTSPKSKPKKK